MSELKFDQCDKCTIVCRHANNRPIAMLAGGHMIRRFELITPAELREIADYMESKQEEN